MAFEGLQDRLKEQWAELSAKIQETSAFNTVREKFESQTPTVQKAIIVGAVALAILFLLSFPFGYLSSSNDNMASFEENRGLIQGLLRASRSAKEISPLPPPMDPGTLRANIDRILHEKKLVGEQIGDMQAIPGDAARDLAPKVVVQNGLAVQLKKLNLTQIIDISNSLQNLGPGTKLLGLDIVQSAGQDHYYDMIARVVNFGLPLMTQPEPENPKDTKGGKGHGPSKASKPEGDE